MILRIHTWTGLASFVSLIVYGIVGISAAFEPSPDTSAPPPEIREIPFVIPPDQTDREVAERVIAAVGIPLARPVQSFAIQHDARGALLLDFRHANGRHRITFPAEGLLRAEITRAPLDRYLSSLHVASAVFHPGDWRMRAWALYNEFAMWCLLVMTASGAWLWLSRHPRNPWALASLAAGCGAFAILFWWSR